MSFYCWLFAAGKAISFDIHPPTWACAGFPFLQLLFFNPTQERCCRNTDFSRNYHGEHRYSGAYQTWAQERLPAGNVISLSQYSPVGCYQQKEQCVETQRVKVVWNGWYMVCIGGEWGEEKMLDSKRNESCCWYLGVLCILPAAWKMGGKVPVYSWGKRRRLNWQSSESRWLLKFNFGKRGDGEKWKGI
jgi:hypothetical protein